jgi:GTP-binding protein HflX
MSMAKKAILVVSKNDSEAREAVELAESAGYTVVEVVKSKKLGVSKFGITQGKALEIKEKVASRNADLVIIDSSLKSSQSFNLMKLLGVPVVDREKLILEIFALRARTPEAKLQVKLAELIYEMPRARELVRRVRMGEQPGLYGYGEYEVERYYDHVRRMQVRIKRELERMHVHRRVQRDARRRHGYPLVSLAGYTRAGKTTLFNVLTKEKQPVLGRAFSTLTTTTRSAWVGGDQYVLLTDTVGFISRIPHYMIEAFKSTLEELRYSDLILLVVDISEPLETVRLKLETSLNTLKELSVDMTRVIYVFNKIDLLGESSDKVGSELRDLISDGLDSVYVSAKKKTGISELRSKIRGAIAQLFTVSEETSPELLAR